ncbi:MAG: hypothetical protein NC218_04460 [Acetobacter sp.]|nr:hypothetical protein [Acetobacter sp.]
MEDYNELDNFLSTSTWYTKHPCDMGRFYEALDTVFKNKKDKFNADLMGDYMADFVDVNLDDDSIQTKEKVEAILYYVSISSAIYGYINR